MNKQLKFCIISIISILSILLSAARVDSNVAAAGPTVFSFASIGDAQAEAGNFTATLNQIGSLNPDLVLFNGDLENNGVTSAEMDPMITALKNANLYNKTFLVRGNHDDTVSGSAALWESYFESAANIKTLPIGVTDYVSLDSSSDYLNYSYIYGNAMFVGLDVPGDVDLLTTDQLNWLDARLTYAESLGLTHAFIYFHGPMYCVESTHCNSSTRTDESSTPTELVTVINEHPIISAFFHGHEHVLGWTHMDNTRLAGLTGSFEQFLTAPSGGWAYNEYVYPDRMDYYYPNMESSQGFGMVSVEGASFTFSIYKVGATTPVWSKIFTKGAVPATPSSTTVLTNTPTNTLTETATTGTTYYVDNTVLCSDSGSGSLANPFCTITRGAYRATVAGDTVHVLHGTYAETVFVEHSGTAGNPITFHADPGVTVTGNPAGFGSAFAVSTQSYVVIDGFNITDTPIQGIYVDASNHITISNNHVSYAGTLPSHPYAQGIYLRNTTDSTITGNTTDHNTCIGIRVVTGGNNLISNNVSFSNYSVVETDAAGIELTGSSYNTVINNITYSNEDSGINVYLFDATDPAVDIPSTHNLIIGNLSYENGDHGIDNNNAPYNTLIGNTVQGNGTVGINFEGETGTGSHHATVINNISVGNGFTPPTISFGGNLRVDSNSITGTILDYNLYDRQSATVQIVWNNDDYLSLAAFHVAEPGQEVHGLEGNPLFVNPVPSALRNDGIPYVGAGIVGDYSLKPGSPAIDSANSNAPSEQLYDIAGNIRFDNPATVNTGVGTRTYDDRGAYEYRPVTPVTVNGIIANSKIYNGNTGAIINTSGAALVGVVPGEDVQLDSTTATGAFSDKNVGTGKTVTISGLTLSGADAHYYLLTQPTATASISAKDLTVSAAGVNKVYNGTTVATVTLSTNAVAGDTVTPAYNSASFANSNVGNVKSINVNGISISGSSVGNYHLLNTTTATTANITKAPLTVTADNKSINVGQPDPTFTFIYSGLVNGETSTVIDTPPVCSVAVLHSTKGTYPIGCSGGSDNNYSFNYVNATLTVIKPFVQIFSDVPVDQWAAHSIHAIYEAGITGGCSVGPLQYCPGATVTRAQMAIFLLRAIHGSSYAPPTVGSSTGFGDVQTTYWAAAWIKQLVAEGITAGCGNGNYCPESPVTRAQMAIFLLRSKYGASYGPPAVGSSTGFVDVQLGYWAAPWIKQLVAEGITSGCGSGNYCPESPVSRDQMAVFLTRTFNLPIP
jgi:parallel beta-helix repeat (two copies)